MIWSIIGFIIGCSIVILILAIIDIFRIRKYMKYINGKHQ